MKTNQSARRHVLRGLAAALGLPAIISGCADNSAARAGIRVLNTPRGGTVPAAAYDAVRDRLHIAYLDGQDVYGVESADVGSSFGEPRRVNDRPKFANGGLFRGPELAVGEDGTVHALWYSRAREAQGADKSEQGVMYTRRASAAQDFEPSRNLGREPSDGYSIATFQRQVALAWHNDEQLRLLRSVDGGTTFGAASTLPALPCECCATQVVFDAGGDPLVVFRDRTGDRRDMFVAPAAAGGARAGNLKLDAVSWVIKACPVSGTSASASRAGLVVAWEHEGRILVARVDAARWQRGDPLALGAGKFPIVLDNQRSLLVAWVDGKNLRWKRFEATTWSALDEGRIARRGMDRAAGVVGRGGEFVLVV